MTPKPFALTLEQVRFYRKNGYLIIEDVVSLEDCDKANSIFERFAELVEDTEYKGRMNFDRESTHIHALFTHLKIVAILRLLRGKPKGGVIGLQTMFLYKKAGSHYATQAWNPHQDNSYTKLPFGTYLTANLPFTNQDPENGGMYIYPGSHKGGLFECEKLPSFREKPEDNPGNRVKYIPKKYSKVDLYLKKGSVLILHGDVIHGSYPNLTKNRDRPMLLMVYADKGVPFPRGGNANRQETILEESE